MVNLNSPDEIYNQYSKLIAQISEYDLNFTKTVKQNRNVSEEMQF